MQRSGFFNSVGGDRIYDATDFAAYFGDLVSNGIFDNPQSDVLSVTAAATGLRVNVAPGSGWINGYHYRSDAQEVISLETADGTYTRYDRIVLRLNVQNRNVLLGYVKGVPAAAPSPPALTRNANIWELGLAVVTVGKAVISLTNNDVRDTRLDTTLCGLVNSLVASVYE
jgi:hypothetical protein